LIGGQLLVVAPGFIPLPLLAAILLVSAAKVWRHGRKKRQTMVVAHQGVPRQLY
jgi:hypothetical protein